MRDYYLGIDLGTTNTVVAVAQKTRHGVKAEVLPIPQRDVDGFSEVSLRNLPSSFYLEKTGHISPEPVVGQFAKMNKEQFKDNIINYAKNFMGRDTTWEIDGDVISPEMVSSYYIRQCLNAFNEKYGESSSIAKVTITVPASFDLQQRAATIEAARLAGLSKDKIMLVSEPTSALIDFVNDQGELEDSCRLIDFSEGKRVLVFDIGGGTLDISVLNVSIVNEVFDIEEEAVSDHTLLGGYIFDFHIVEYLVDKYKRETGIDLKSREDYKAVQSYMLMCAERNKMAVHNIATEGNSNQLNSREFKIQRINMGGLPNNILDIRYSYSDMVKATSSLIEGVGDVTIDKCIKSTLTDAGIDSDEIDEVLVCGGMSKFKLIQDYLEDKFKKKPLCVLDPMESVANGAAVYNYFSINSTDKSNSMNVDSKLNFGVFMACQTGLPMEILRKGVRMNTQYKSSCKVTSSTEMTIDLVSGKNVYDLDLRRVGKLVVKFDKPVTPGSKVILNSCFDSKGFLSVKCTINDTCGITEKDAIFEYKY